MKINRWFVLGVAGICLFIGHSAGVVGQKTSGEVFTWQLPLIMGTLLTSFFLCGFLAGKGDDV